MTVLPVLHHPDKRLRERSQEVDVAEIQTPEFQNFLDDMIETMKAENGVGLAAPQINVRTRVMIVETAKGPMPFINPEIIRTSRRMINSEEGCLSVPGKFGIVKRHKHVKLTAFDRNGDELTIKAGGFQGTIFQHEIDHLNGVLFIDKAIDIQELTPEKEHEII